MISEHLPNNCYASRVMPSVDGAVIHYISARYTKPNNPFDRDAITDILKQYKFSYKYLIERDGTRVELVPGNHVAYHAGFSRMNDRDMCNEFTVGIALAGGSLWPYTDEQIIELGKLLIELMTEHRFNSDWIKGHDEVREAWNETYPDNAEDRKRDPGAHFPWEIVKGMIASVSMQVKYEQSLK